MASVEAPTGRFREDEYTYWLTAMVRPEVNAGVAREIVTGLLSGVSGGLVERAATEAIWGWSCRVPPAPDPLLGDENDRGVAVMEFKSPGADVNWTARRIYRHLTHGADPLSVRIRDEVLARSRPEFDHGHFDDECGGTPRTCGDAGEEWKGTVSGRHYPCLHQGDVYATTTDYMPAGFRVDSLRDLRYVFVAPHQKAVEVWKDGLRSIDEWTVVMLPDVLRVWEQRAALVPGLDVVVRVTRDFLRLS